MPYLGLEDVNVTGVEDILKYPLTGDYYFWGKILLAIFFVITLTTYFKERERLGKGNLLSSLAIGGLATIVLSAVGSLFGIITKDILLYSFTFGIILIIIWWLND